MFLKKQPVSLAASFSFGIGAAPVLISGASWLAVGCRRDTADAALGASN